MERAKLLRRIKFWLGVLPKLDLESVTEDDADSLMKCICKSLDYDYSDFMRQSKMAYDSIIVSYREFIKCGSTEFNEGVADRMAEDFYNVVIGCSDQVDDVSEEEASKYKRYLEDLAADINDDRRNVLWHLETEADRCALSISMDMLELYYELDNSITLLDLYNVELEKAYVEYYKKHSDLCLPAYDDLSIGYGEYLNLYSDDDITLICTRKLDISDLPEKDIFKDIYRIGLKDLMGKQKIPKKIQKQILEIEKDTIFYYIPDGDCYYEKHQCPLLAMVYILADSLCKETVNENVA